MHLLSLLLLTACTGPEDFGTAPDVCVLPLADPPGCGTGLAGPDHLIPGPGQSGYDEEIAAKIDALDRLATALSAADTGASGVVSLTDADDAALVDAFLETGEWRDAELVSAVDTWHKATGAFAGPAIAADAYRYGALRDGGADCDEVAAARERMFDALNTLHVAQQVTGTEGVIARAMLHNGLPGGDSIETTELFDGIGDALPYDKNNGTWRDDQSNLYPDIIWEDSASRDQYIGWVTAMVAGWEVLQGDLDFPDEYRLRLRRDARALAHSLMTVQESGYDLEIRDADGRMTYHGILHEESVDRTYVPGASNALNPVMVLGIVAALALIADDVEVDVWLHDVLIEQRQLHALVRDHVGLNELGARTNYSNLNMAWLGAWLSQRFLCDTSARAAVAEGMEDLYSPTGQTLYDLVRATTQGEVTAYGARWDLEDSALLGPVQLGLFEYPAAPVWHDSVIQCDSDEIDAGECVLNDGSMVTLLGYVGHGDSLVADAPLPMSARPRSTYYWRSDPHGVNGEGQPTNLLPADDVRFVYWAGRWARR